MSNRHHMVKLCWMQEGAGKRDYYYSFPDNMIYCANMQEYEHLHGWGPTLLICLVGPIASFLGSVARSRSVLIDSVQIAIIVVSTIVVVFGTHLVYGKSKKYEEDYIRGHGYSEDATKTELRRLYSYGKKYRGGLSVFIVISTLMAVVGITITITGALVGTIIYYLGVWSAAIWTELLSPIDQLRVSSIINKERK